MKKRREGSITTLQVDFFVRLIMIGWMLRMFINLSFFSRMNHFASIRDAIREFHPRYPITAHAWPAFLYQKVQYDPQRPSEGLFKGELLVRVCHSYHNAIITSLELSCTYFLGFPMHFHVPKFCS